MKKSKHSLLLKLFVLIGLTLLLSSNAHAWRVQLPGGSRAETVVVDANGDVIAAGRAFYGGELIKLSGTTGELIWQFNASHNVTEQGFNAIALDSHGDVFALIGTSRGVIKISGVTGQVIWTRGIGGTIAGCQSVFLAVVVDREDDVVIAGTSGCLFSVGKLDGATGNERWHYEHEGYAKAVAVDPFGNVAAAGIINKNFGVVKLRGDDGAQLWEQELNGAGNFTDVSGFEQANAVAMDQDGSVVVVGSTQNEVGNFGDFTVARYLPDGTFDWIKIIDGQFRANADDVDHSDDSAGAVVIDKDGGVIAAGRVRESLDIPARPEPEHFHVIKISRAGEVVWSRPAQDPIPAPPGEPEYVRGEAFSLSVNAYGNIVAAGVHNNRFTLVKFWGRTGGQAWRRQLSSGVDPTSNNGNHPARVVMDADSDVIAAGETLPPEGGLSQFTVTKLRRIDGLDYSLDPPPDPAPDTVVDNAPVVYLHSDDDYRPDDPMKFIQSSALKWSHEGSILHSCGDDTDADLGSIDVERLASETSPYEHSPHAIGSCDHWEEIRLKSSDYTRPHDGSKRRNILGQVFGYEKEGYYLDPDNDDNELRAGVDTGPSVFPGAPVFYEYVRHEYVTYWFFYPYDKLLLQAHEGDWERITVVLDDSDRALSYVYEAHGHSTPLAINDIEFEGTHPVVYSAKGSHASFQRTGDFPTEVPFVEDHANRGPRWITWDHLLDAPSQPWYGFGGAWGEVGESGSTTGPLGPSKFKPSPFGADPRVWLR